MAEPDFTDYDAFVARQNAKGIYPTGGPPRPATAPPAPPPTGLRGGAAATAATAPASLAPAADPYETELARLADSARGAELGIDERAALARATKPGVIPGGFQAGLYGGGASIAKTFGFDDTARALQEEAKRVAPELDYRKVRGLRSGLLYMSGVTASAAGSTLPVVGGGIAGAVAGGLAGGAPGAAIGAGVGAYGAAFPLEMGEFLLDAQERGLDPNDPKVRQAAMDKAATNAAWEAVVPGAATASSRLLRGMFKTGARTGAAAAGAAAPAAAAAPARIGTRALAGGFGEAGTEAAQEVTGMETMARLTGEPVNYQDPEVRARLVNAILGGAGFGTVMGGASGIGTPRLPSGARRGDSTSELRAPPREDDGRVSTGELEVVEGGPAGPGAPPAGVPPGGGGRPPNVGPAASAIYARSASAISQAGTAAPPGELYQPGVEAAPPSAPITPGAPAPRRRVIDVGEQAGVGARQVLDTARAAAEPAGEAIARTARAVVDQVGNMRDELVQAWRNGTVSKTEVGQVLDAGLQQAVAVAPEDAKPAVVAQALIGDGPFTAKEPSAQADVLTKPAAEVSNFLAGGVSIPNTVPPGQEGAWLAENYAEQGAERTRAARLTYDALPDSAKGQIGANPDFGSEQTQSAIADANSKEDTTAKVVRLRGLRNAKRNYNREYTQNEYAIRDSVEKALFDREQAALDASGLAGDKLIHALGQAKARSTEKANEYAAAIREIFIEPATRDDPTAGPGRSAGRTLVPTQDMIHVYSELLADTRNAPAAQAIFDQAKRLYQSNIDVSLLQTVGDNGPNIVQEYVNTINPNTYFSKAQAKQLLAIIQSALAGNNTGGLDKIRTGFMATFGGSPNTFEALVSRIHALNRQVLTAQVRESAEGPATTMRFAPEGGAQIREPGGFGERLGPRGEPGDFTAEEAVEAEREAEAAAEETAAEEMPAIGYGAQEEEVMPEFRIGSKEMMLPSADPKRIQSVLEGIRSGAFGDVTARAMTIDEAVDALSGMASRGEIAMEAGEVRDYVLNQLRAALARSPAAADQRTELGAALGDVNAYNRIADKYTIFVMEPRVEQHEGLRQIAIERIKSGVVSKGSAENGTLSLLVPWRGGKPARQEFSAVELVNRTMGTPSRLRDRAEADPNFVVKIARSLSRGLGSLVQGVKADNLFAQVPKPAAVTGKLPQDMVETAKMVGKKGERIGLEMLLSPAYQNSVLNWLATVVPRGEHGRKIPDADVQLGTTPYTLQVSSSMLRVIDRDGNTVAGPQLRNDLLVYRTKGGKDYTVGDLAEAVSEVNREANVIRPEDVSQKVRDGVEEALGKYGDAWTLFTQGLAMSPAERDALPYAKKLKSLENWARASARHKGKFKDLYLYSGPTKEVGKVGGEIDETEDVAIGDEAMHETRIVQEDLYDEGGELLAKPVGQAEIIEEPRTRTLRRPGTKAEELLGLNIKVVRRQNDARPIKLGSKDPADWPLDVRADVEAAIEPLYRAHVKVQGQKFLDEEGKLQKPQKGKPIVESLETFIRARLEEKGAIEKTKPVVAANAVLDRYYGLVKQAEARTVGEGQGAYTRQQRTVAAASVQRVPELETLEFMRRTAEQNESERRAAEDEFGAPLYPTTKELRPTAQRVMGAIDRAEKANESPGAKRILAAARKALKEGRMNDTELKILGSSIASNIVGNVPAIGSVLTELNGRVEARAAARKVLAERKRVLTDAELEAIGGKPVTSAEEQAISNFEGYPQPDVTSPGPLTDISEEALRTAANPSATSRVIRAGEELIRLRNEASRRAKAKPLTPAQRAAGEVDISLSARDRIYYRNAIRAALTNLRAEQAANERQPVAPRAPEAAPARTVEGEVLPAETVPEEERPALPEEALQSRLDQLGYRRSGREQRVDDLASQQFFTEVEALGGKLTTLNEQRARVADVEENLRQFVAEYPDGRAFLVEEIIDHQKVLAGLQGESTETDLTLYATPLERGVAAPPAGAPRAPRRRVITAADQAAAQERAGMRSAAAPVEAAPAAPEGKFGEAPAAPPAAEGLYRAQLNRITAAVVTDAEGNVTETAPVWQKFVGQPVAKFQKWVESKGGTVTQMGEAPAAPAATPAPAAPTALPEGDRRGWKMQVRLGNEIAVVYANQDGTVISAKSPLLKWSIGKKMDALSAWVDKKGGKLSSTKAIVPASVEVEAPAAAPAAPAAAPAAPRAPGAKRVITEADQIAAQERAGMRRPGGAPTPEGKLGEVSLTSQAATAAASGAETILLPEGAVVDLPPGFVEPIPGHLERVQTPRGTSAPAGVTIHSGGAAGADTAFGKIGTELGLETIAHSFAGHRPTAGSGRQQIHSPAELKAADALLSKVNSKYLKRRFPPGSDYVTNLLRRNYYQVRDSEAVIAVSNIGTDGVVQGGTGWAAYMGVELGKPTYVYDQTSRRWHEWKDGDWVMTGIPPPYKSFAGVGSRDLELHGERAIRDYLSQFESGPKTLVQPGEGLVPRETIDRVINEIRKLLGNKVAVSWEERNFGGSGEWIRDSKDAFAGVIRLAVTAADAMGVAHHEAMHALLERLQATPEGRRAVELLVRATSTPEVIQQLRAALQGHPEAQEQLTDPLERVTYAYQFYRANSKGFRLASPARGWFKRMVDWLRDVTGFINDTQRAERVFEAFGQGTFASPALMNDFLTNKLDQAGSPARWAGAQKNPLTHMLQKAAYTGDSLLRNSGIPSLVEIAERIQNRVGGSAGFLPERMRIGSQWINRLASTVEGYSDEELAAANRNLQLKKRPTSNLEIGIRQLYKDFYDYLSDAGVQQFSHMEKGQPVWKPIPYRKDYHHNLWVPEEIEANREEFEAILASHGFEDPAAIAESIVSGMSAEDNIQGNFKDGYTPLFGGASARQLDSVYDDPRSLKFRSDDLIETMHRYLWQGVHRAEHTRQFGHRGDAIRALTAKAREEGATEAQIDAATEYIMAAEGTLGAQISPELRRLFGAITVYQNFRILPLSLFSQLADPLGIVIRGGTFRDAARAFVRGIKGAFQGLDDSEIAEIARLIGTIDDKSALEALGQIYGSVHLSPAQRAVNDKFFKVIGLTGWNNGMRVAGTEAALSFFKNQLENPGKHTTRWLNDLGLEPGDLQLTADGKRIRLLNGEGLHPDQVKRVQQAVNRWVNEAIMRPTAADRPIYGSDPRFALIFYLKQFTYSFHKYILMRTLTEAKHGNYTPLLALGSYVPIMIAADFARAMIQGAGEEPEWRKKWTTSDYVTNGIQRAGLGGLGQFAFDAVEDTRRGNTGIESILGPTIAQGLGGLQVLGGEKDLSNYLVSAMPGQVIYKHWF